MSNGFRMLDDVYVFGSYPSTVSSNVVYHVHAGALTARVSKVHVLDGWSIALYEFDRESFESNGHRVVDDIHNAVADAFKKSEYLYREQQMVKEA